MNDNEKDRIAAAVNALRPDWPTKSIRTLLDGAQLTNRTRRDTAVALAWVACESASKTPARVLEAGPWWTAAAHDAASLPPRPPKRDEACADCGRTQSQHINGPDDEHEWRQAGTAANEAAISTAAALARAELAQTRANTCLHGVIRSRVTCDECTKADAEAARVRTETQEPDTHDTEELA